MRGGQASAVRQGGQEERGHKAGGAWKHVWKCGWALRLARIWGKKTNKSGGPTAKLSRLGDWEDEGGHFPETEKPIRLFFLREEIS